MLEVNSFIIPVLQIRTLINRGDWTKITMAKNWCGLILKTVALSSEIIWDNAYKSIFLEAEEVSEIH